jgi:hypothetical protein
METFIISVATPAPTGNVTATTEDLQRQPELYFAVRTTFHYLLLGGSANLVCT